MDIGIDGSAQLKRLSEHIKLLGEEGLGKEFGKALRDAAKPVQTSIRAEYGHLPSRGGYSALFSKSLRFRTQLRAARTDATFRVTTYADGTRQRRDINALEDGRLRHPVFGRSRGGRRGERLANPWAVTRVRGDFHKRGSAKALDDATREMLKVVDEFQRKIVEDQ